MICSAVTSPEELARRLHQHVAGERGEQLGFLDKVQFSEIPESVKKCKA